MINNKNTNQAFWAAYSNVAAYNVAIIIAHINSKIENKTKEADEESLGKIEDLFDMVCVDNPNNKKKIDFLYKYMPFIWLFVDYIYNQDKTSNGIPFFEKRIINNNDKNDVESREVTLTEQIEIIKELFQLLLDIRNNQSHFVGSNYFVNDSMFRALEYCFDVSLRTTITRFWDDAKDANNKLEHLKRHDNKGKIKKEFIYKFKNIGVDKNNFTTNGLAFFLCLFLDKRMSKLMLDQISGFKRNDSKEYRATINVFTIDRIRLPKEKIESVFSLDSLGLDIINELQKCPKELYDLLSQEDRNKFVLIDEETEDETILKRSQNRFSYFVMRYFDEKEIFKNIRFHIDLGLYNKDCYEKTLKDGSKLEDRFISKRLKGFGRIQEMNTEFEKHKKEYPDFYVQDKNEKNYQIPNRMPTFPHYHYANEEKTLIGLKIKDKVDYKYSDIERNNFILEKPDAYISTYEFPAMYFCEYLKGNPEQVLIDTYNTIIDFLKKIASNDNSIEIFRDEITGKTEDEIKELFKNEFKLDINDIPKELKVYISTKPAKSKNTYQEYLKQKMDTMLEEAKKEYGWIIDKENRIKERRIKAGKKNYEKINIGDIALKLVKDIIYLTPISSKNNGKDGITSPNYNRLQEHFALWVEKERRFKAIEILNAFKIFDKHPFLNKLGKIEDISSIVILYKAYMLSKINYLNEKAVKGKYGIDILSNDKENKKALDYETYSIDLAKKLLELPINLPRNMFYEEIVKSKELETLRRYIYGKRANVSYLIKLYLNEKLKDDSQEFYKYDRMYKFFKEGRNNKNVYHELNRFDEKVSEIKEQIKNNQDNPNYKFYKQFTENEKQLRLLQTQDVLLFLMAKSILFNEVETKFIDKTIQSESILLKNIGIGGKSVLEEKTKVNLSLSVADYYLFIEDTLKIKNYGDFKYFCFDKRVSNYLECLLKTFNDNQYKKGGNPYKIKRQEIEKELENYETYRIAAFEKILEFERIFFQNYYTKEEFESINNGTHFSFEKIIKEFIEKTNAESEICKLIKSTRNAFSHSQYPMQDNWLRNRIDEKNKSNMLDIIYNDFSESIE
ncbi:MAG TPA: hypothetical protein DD434_02590, partial [Bacteroidales bacterium]|nr:hypothetical protein [Bacteroidales bacterium]